MRKNKQHSGNIFSIRAIVITMIWLVLILFAFVNRDKITLEAITSIAGEYLPLSIIILLCLYALKSIVMVFYGGLLYIAGGMLFPLPIAIAVNLIGNVIMTAIPYWIGKSKGSKPIATLTSRYPKLEIIRSVPAQSGFVFTLIFRLAGVLPGDLVGMYLGASGVRYRNYLSGTMLGMLPSLLSCTIMGTSITDIHSPAFKISACIEIALIILSMVIFHIWKSRSRKQSLNPSNNSEGCFHNSPPEITKEDFS